MTWIENSKSIGHYDACLENGMSSEEIKKDWIKTEKEMEKAMTLEAQLITKPTELVTKESQTVYKNTKGHIVLTLQRIEDDGRIVWDIPCSYHSTEKLRDLHAAISLVLDEFSQKNFNDSNNLPF